MESEKNIELKTGYIDEGYLKELVEEPEVSGGAWTSILCIGGIIAATMQFDACPTSACTKSCNR